MRLLRVLGYLVGNALFAVALIPAVAWFGMLAARAVNQFVTFSAKFWVSVFEWVAGWLAT